MEPEITIAICNHNMSDTLGESMNSILQHTDSRFEILVIDDASTDNSVEVLDRLNKEHARVRYRALEQDPSRRLGETRNISVKESDGDYVILQMDADDRYSQGIVDFVNIFKQIEEQTERQYYLKGNSINIARREFLLDYGPYRNLGIGGEDRDLWRRLFADDAIIWLDHEPFWEEIQDYKTSPLDKIKRDFTIKTADFQVGVTFKSCLRYSIENKSSLYLCQDLLTLPLAYLYAQQKLQYDTPEKFREKRQLSQTIQDQRETLDEVERELGVDIDRAELSDRGLELFYG